MKVLAVFVISVSASAAAALAAPLTASPQGSASSSGPRAPQGLVKRTLSEVPRAGFPEVDFLVEDMVRHGDRLFVGGNFQRIGPACGSLVRVDDVSAEMISSDPRFTGFVEAAVSDGNGGAFVGGDFTVEGSPLTLLAHVLSDGSVVPVTTGLDAGKVFAMDFDPATGVLYVVGAFSEVDGVPRSRAAAFDVATGTLLPWSPAIQASDFTPAPYCVALAGGRVWLGGNEFHDFDDDPNDNVTDLRNLVTCDPVTGTLDPYDFGLDDYVWCMAESGGRVFVGGAFTQARGIPRGRLAAFSVLDFTLDPLDVSFNDDLRSLTVDGTELFVGGFYTQVEGQIRRRAASIDLVAGSLTGWSPKINGGGAMVAAILVNPSGVFLGGKFADVDGEAHRALVLVDRATGVPLGANHGFAGASPYPGDVQALVQGDGQVFAGGNLHFEDVTFQRHLAVVEIPSGAVDGSLQPPEPNASVALMDANGDTVFIAGQFKKVGGVPRHHLAAVDPATGSLVTTFDPDLSGAVSTDVVALAAGDTALFVGTQAYWPSRFDILALDPSTGQQLASFQQQTGDVSLHALALSADGETLYVGGYFSEFGSPPAPRAALAAVDATTGELLGWEPEGCEAVHAVEPVGDRLYAAGYADVPLYGIRDYTFAFDLETAALLPWAPPLGDVSTMLGVSLEAATGRMLIGAQFHSFDGVPAYTAAAVDLQLGQTADWMPAIIGTAGCFVSHPEAVIVGGNFSRVGEKRRQGMAAFSYGQ